MLSTFWSIVKPKTIQKFDKIAKNHSSVLKEKVPEENLQKLLDKLKYLKQEAYTKFIIRAD